MVGGGAPAVIAALVEPGEIRTGAVTILSEAETHHLKVRRAAPGAVVRLHDGAGGTAEATVLELGKRAHLRVDRSVHHPRLPLLRLVVGAGDRDRFEWLAEKAGEFGVTELVPLDTRRSDAVATRVRPSHLERIQRRAREAIKQSGAPWAPVVTAPMSAAEVCDRFREGTRWLADRSGGHPVAARGAAVTAVIGPEGGWSTEEQAGFLAAGFEPVRLGPHLLRFETAALAVAALVRVSHTGEANG